MRDFENWFLWQLWANVFFFFWFRLMLLYLFLICCSYADRDQLQAIYSAYLQPVLSSSLKSHPVWGAVKNVHTLAGSMVAVYEQVPGFQVLRVCSLGYGPSMRSNTGIRLKEPKSHDASSSYAIQDCPIVTRLTLFASRVICIKFILMISILYETQVIEN